MTRVNKIYFSEIGILSYELPKSKTKFTKKAKRSSKNIKYVEDKIPAKKFFLKKIFKIFTR